MLLMSAIIMSSGCLDSNSDDQINDTESLSPNSDSSNTAENIEGGTSGDLSDAGVSSEGTDNVTTTQDYETYSVTPHFSSGGSSSSSSTSPDVSRTLNKPEYGDYTEPNGTISGDLTITGTIDGTITLPAGLTVNGDLTVNTPSATVYNYATVGVLLISRQSAFIPGTNMAMQTALSCLHKMQHLTSYQEMSAME
ncbi:hypothetical protein RE474_10050 [Methanolobus sediminis]|uniref:Uncharacterized protein n=1 Tax=Methanolobus sediminis TaxID=3072978 RepID=A0AA51UIZ6_9EURY|nr:hypothetical protein [Methanolobus sediminis]WMW24426.1 hypothetical protein RE474_10050 [Methanolobus sediminis]